MKSKSSSQAATFAWNWIQNAFHAKTAKGVRQGRKGTQLSIYHPLSTIYSLTFYLHTFHSFTNSLLYHLHLNLHTFHS